MVSQRHRVARPPRRPRCRGASSAAAVRAPSWPRSTTRRSPSPSPPRPLPVFTGLGHEIDRSVADEVAHTRAEDADGVRRGAGRAGGRVPRASSSTRGTAIGQRAERSVDRHDGTARRDRHRPGRPCPRRARPQRRTARTTGRCGSATARRRVVERADVQLAAAVAALGPGAGSARRRGCATSTPLQTQVRLLDPVTRAGAGLQHHPRRRRPCRARRRVAVGRRPARHHLRQSAPPPVRCSRSPTRTCPASTRDRERTQP